MGAGWIRGARTGTGTSSETVAGEAEHGVGGAFEEVSARTTAQLLVLFDVDVNGEDPHHLGQNERQTPEIKGPAVRVVPLLIFILFRRDVTQGSRDVDDHSNDVTQT